MPGTGLVPYGESMPHGPRQIFAFSGLIGAPGERPSFDLVRHAIGLTGVPDGETIRVCYVPTAVGDAQRAVEVTTRAFENVPHVELTTLALFPQPTYRDVREHLLSQHMIFVEGGSVVNLMAVWRVHGLRPIMRECWENGIVLAGVSAGSICWHLGGPTDSYSDDLDPFEDGIGLLPYSNGVHDDFPEQPRRETYRNQVAKGITPAGYASEDGVGLHYIDERLHEAVAIREGKTAWWVEPGPDGTYVEKRIETRLI
jgi:peptidase E